MYIGRNEDGSLAQFKYQPWMDGNTMKWCFTNDDGSHYYGETVEESDLTKDLKFEDRPIYIED